MKPVSVEALAPDLPIQCQPQTLYGLPKAHPRTPEQILRVNHGRTPLRCDDGEVRQDWAVIQAAAAGSCGIAVRCLADENVIRAADLDVGECFAFRAEDLRGQGLTYYRLTGPLQAEAIGIDHKCALQADTLVVRFADLP